MSAVLERIQRHWADPSSYDRRIALGFFWVSFFVFVSKLAGAAKEMTIAWRYGVSDTVDAYVFIFNLLNWPITVWLAILTVVLVPLVIRMRHEEPQQLRRFGGELLTVTLLVGICLLVLARGLMPMLLRSRWVGLPAPAVAQALDMIGWMVWMTPLGLVVSLFSAWTMACGRHRNTLLEAMPALTILVALIAPRGWLVEPLALGTVAGYALQAVGLVWPLARAGEVSIPKARLQSSAWRGLWEGVRLIGLGQAFMSLTTVVDQFFAAHLGSGAIATLNYGNRIMALVLGLGAVAISRATLPIFSEATAKDVSVKRLAFRWATWMLVGGVAVVLLLSVLAPWLVRHLFQRGAFTSADTVQVAGLLRLLVIQVPVYFFGLVMVSALSSQRDYTGLTLSCVIAVVVKPLATALLIPRFQVGGVAMSSAIVYLSTAVFMGVRLRNR
jgi:putative peptidoglycan lipid II flippase